MERQLSTRSAGSTGLVWERWRFVLVDTRCCSRSCPGRAGGGVETVHAAADEFTIRNAMMYLLGCAAVMLYALREHLNFWSPRKTAGTTIGLSSARAKSLWPISSSARPRSVRLAGGAGRLFRCRPDPHGAAARCAAIDCGEVPSVYEAAA